MFYTPWRIICGPGRMPARPTTPSTQEVSLTTASVFSSASCSMKSLRGVEMKLSLMLLCAVMKSLREMTVAVVVVTVVVQWMRLCFLRELPCRLICCCRSSVSRRSHPVACSCRSSVSRRSHPVACSWRSSLLVHCQHRIPHLMFSSHRHIRWADRWSSQTEKGCIRTPPLAYIVHHNQSWSFQCLQTRHTTPLPPYVHYRTNCSDSCQSCK